MIGAGFEDVRSMFSVLGSGQGGDGGGSIDVRR